ncbi:MAG: trehalose-phosphatase [Candidatus Omnitrophota bacterium]
MKHLIKEWSRIKKDLKGKDIYLFLDFDGTLTRIRKRPGAVRLGREVKGILKDIAKENVPLAIISGRSLEEIKRLVGVKGIIYAGNHGLEVEGPKHEFVVPEASRAKKTVAKIGKQLKQELSSFRGVLIEDKGLTLSVHFRMAKKEKLGQIEQAYKRMISPYISAGKIVVTSGKKVWEVRPPVRWDKGKAASLLLKKRRQKSEKRIVSFYIGDDRTDEDAFRLLRKKAYTVKVGRKEGERTLAGYYLENTQEVKKFLKIFLALKREEKDV